ncbi:MAG: hypothetical protein LBR37_02100 [Erysipelotrichaceae bacterium]|jgi:uncharacterized protein|nr:hypothetical protein [Erysipelotrichaceae bacterium]
MDQRIKDKIDHFISEYHNSFEYQTLISANNSLETDFELHTIRTTIDIILDRIAAAVKQQDHENIKQQQQALQAQKLLLDTNPLIVSYNNAFKQIREIDNYLNEVLLSKFHKKKLHQCAS